MRAFIGSEAIADGALTRGRLRWNYVAIHPDVYLENGYRRDIMTNAHAAWLWTRRTGIIAGQAAAAMHGVGTVCESTPIEMIATRCRRRPGVVMRRERIEDDEVQSVARITVTTAARTALDLARHLPRDTAVAHLDRLAAVTGIGYSDATALADRYRGARGSVQAREALALMDGGTRCPEESRIRLALHDAGLPRPRTNIVLQDGDDIATIGMGWDEARVGVSYYEPEDIAGLADPYRIVQEIRHQDMVQGLGWRELRVVPAHTRRSVVFRVRRALRERGG
jgi:hypothetical protein